MRMRGTLSSPIIPLLPMLQESAELTPPGFTKCCEVKAAGQALSLFERAVGDPVYRLRCELAHEMIMRLQDMNSSWILLKKSWCVLVKHNR